MNSGIARLVRGSSPTASGVSLFRGAAGTRDAGGFTLLELCVVLLILGILMAVIAPNIQSAFAEQALRSDAQQLSFMVKTGMMRTSEEHRPYTLDLNETTLALAPARSLEEPATASPSNAAPDAVISDTITQSWHLTAQNKLLLPDPKAAGHWRPIESAQWIFRPGELCPATQVCFVRGEARLQMGFNALTGNVEDETSFVP